MGTKQRTTGNKFEAGSPIPEPSSSVSNLRMDDDTLGTANVAPRCGPETGRICARLRNMRHKRVIVTHYGGPEVITVVEEDIPTVRQPRAGSDASSRLATSAIGESERLLHPSEGRGQCA